ncbi:MAG: polyprenyl diphosphate synthase [Thermoplasmata archaeon]
MTDDAPDPPSSSLSEIVGSAFKEAQERKLLELVLREPVPRHLAIIMDGNRRFAQDHHLLIPEGHLQGRKKLEDLLDWCLEVNIRVLTVFALSTENLQRSSDEVRTLMDLFERSFQEVAVDERVHRHQIRVRALGRRELLPDRVRAAIDLAESATSGYSSYHCNIAIAYGGRDEIVQAIRRIAEEVRDGRLRPDQIDGERVSQYLYTADQPDPDLVLRTSGEERVSNFLLWQSAYSELYFSDVMWPGLSHFEFLRALRAYQTRRRRYGH